jgi:hypothetical protein
MIKGTSSRERTPEIYKLVGQISGGDYWEAINNIMA